MVDAPGPPASAQVQTSASRPGLLRRMASMAYELLLLSAALLAATAVFLVFGQALDDGWRRPLLQAVLLAVSGVYFIWFWVHRGQTLPMKTWHLRLVDAAGGPVAPRKALARFMLAAILLPAGGIAILWALIDRDGDFLHDRLAGTRIISTRG
jgi:uncharacterized RDD family membrane protein YckC